VSVEKRTTAHKRIATLKNAIAAASMGICWRQEEGWREPPNLSIRGLRCKAATSTAAAASHTAGTHTARSTATCGSGSLARRATPNFVHERGVVGGDWNFTKQKFVGKGAASEAARHWSKWPKRGPGAARRPSGNVLEASSTETHNRFLGIIMWYFCNSEKVALRSNISYMNCHFEKEFVFIKAHFVRPMA